MSKIVEPHGGYHPVEEKGVPVPQTRMKKPKMHEIEKIRNKLLKGAHLAIDHLQGLVPRSAHEEFPYESVVTGGLRQAYEELIKLGKKALEKIKKLFGVAVELVGDTLRINLIETQTVATATA